MQKCGQGGGSARFSGEIGCPNRRPVQNANRGVWTGPWSDTPRNRRCARELPMRLPRGPSGLSPDAACRSVAGAANGRQPPLLHEPRQPPMWITCPTPPHLGVGPTGGAPELLRLTPARKIIVSAKAIGILAFHLQVPWHGGLHLAREGLDGIERLCRSSAEIRRRLHVCRRRRIRARLKGVAPHGHGQGEVVQRPEGVRVHRD